MVTMQDAIRTIKFVELILETTSDFSPHFNPLFAVDGSGTEAIAACHEFLVNAGERAQ